nr:MAG TPA: hypothetical protein [Caudoviricetes sp.]
MFYLLTNLFLALMVVLIYITLELFGLKFQHSIVSVLLSYKLFIL